MSRVSIVMLVRDRLPYTLRCLKTLAPATADAEWILVDEGSSPETREALRRRSQVQALTLLDGPGRGAAAARNLGVRAAGGEVVLFLDNDVFADRDDWLERLLAPLDAPGTVASSCLLLFPGPNELVQSAGGGVTAAGHFGLIGRGLEPSPELVRPRELAWGPTAALAVDRAAFFEAGGFDEAFDPVAVCEDVDLCLRLRAAGGRIAFAAGSRLRHYEGTTFNTLGYDKLAHWKRHARVIRNRWGRLMAAGPVCSAEDIEWRGVIKDYTDLERASVRRATPAEEREHDLSFFARHDAPGGTTPEVDLRVLVAGCGQVALRGALPGLAPPGSELSRSAAPFLDFGGAAGVRVVGVCDPDAARAREAQARSGAVHASTDTERFLREVPAEAAVICTPPAAHLASATAALRERMAVLVEKPAGLDPAALDALCEAHAAAGLPCLVNLPWCYHPAIELAAELVDAGTIGSPRGGRALFEHGGPEGWSADAAWQRRPGGGVIRDLAPHAASALAFALGAPVEAIDPGPAASPLPARAYGSARLAGIDAEIEVGWDASAPRFALELEGDEGRIELELLPWRRAAGGAPLRVTTGAQRTIEAPPGVLDGGPYRHFVACVRSGEPGRTGLAAVAPTLRAVLAWAVAVEAGGG